MWRRRRRRWAGGRGRERCASTAVCQTENSNDSVGRTRGRGGGGKGSAQPLFSPPLHPNRVGRREIANPHLNTFQSTNEDEAKPFHTMWPPFAHAHASRCGGRRRVVHSCADQMGHESVGAATLCATHREPNHVHLCYPLSRVRLCTSHCTIREACTEIISISIMTGIDMHCIILECSAIK